MDQGSFLIGLPHIYIYYRGASQSHFWDFWAKTMNLSNILIHTEIPNKLFEFHPFSVELVKKRLKRFISIT